MNRALTVSGKRRLLSVLESATTVSTLVQVLGPQFHELHAGPAEGAVTYVHRNSMTIVEAPVIGGDLAATASLIEGQDARLYLTDLLERVSSLEDVISLVTDIYGSAPGVIEAFKRGRRLWISSIEAVIELRGRKNEFTVRVLDAESAFSALDAATRMLSDKESLELIVGPMLALEPSRSQSVLTIKHSAVAFRPLASGGYELLTDSALRAAFMESAKSLPSIEACDERIGQWCDYYGRFEHMEPDGVIRVEWRLPGPKLQLVWHGDAVSKVTY